MIVSRTSPSLCFARIESPLGRLLLVGELGGTQLALQGLYFEAAAHAERALPAEATEDPGAFSAVCAQLQAYFDGRLTSFDLPLAPRGTAFQRQVWAALAEIPYGATATYAELARAIGLPRAVRAVGAANGKNPISIIVPCHRVIGANGTLTGYAGGLPNKRWLLDLESSWGS